jgi:hypothetical protein
MIARSAMLAKSGQAPPIGVSAVSFQPRKTVQPAMLMRAVSQLFSIYIRAC